jgi:hypothetical protein
MIAHLPDFLRKDAAGPSADSGRLKPHAQPPTLTERTAFDGHQWPTGFDSGLGLRVETIRLHHCRAGVTCAFSES